MYDTALLIGRFEPVHSGHLALLHEALRMAPQVIVVVGSAWQARSPKNPFTWAEREAMLRDALPPSDRSRVRVLPVRDYYNEAVWVQAVRRSVARHTQPGDRIALVGHFKDATSSYLRAFPSWALIDLPRQGSMDATTIRDAYFGATADTVDQALAPLAAQIPASTMAQLQAFVHTPHYAALQEEWRMLRGYREAWSAAPYPPVFVTVDAVLFWVVWDAERSPQQHAQHVEYTVRPEAGKTRLRFDITMEPSAPLPEFLIKRAKRTVLQAATEGLRQHVMRVARPDA